MIISFEQNPTYYQKMAREARDKGDLSRAVKYYYQAISRRHVIADKLELADVYSEMRRYHSAMDLCFEVLSEHRNTSDAYMILSKVSAMMGKYYESYYYISKKYNLDGDDDSADAVNEAIDDIYAAIGDMSRRKHFYVVGKQSPQNFQQLLEDAFLAHHSGEHGSAIELAESIKEDSHLYRDALKLRLKANISLKNYAEVEKLSEELLHIDSYAGLALHGLAVVCGKTSYAAVLDTFESSDTDSLLYAINVADYTAKYDIALKLAEKLVQLDYYNVNIRMVKMAVLYNMGRISEAKEIIKEAAALYPNRYPLEIILNILFDRGMPSPIINKMHRYAKAYVASGEVFIREFMSSLPFRSTLAYMFEVGDYEIIGNSLKFIIGTGNRAMQKFLISLLLKCGIATVVKKDILAALSLIKQTGKAYVVIGYIMSKVTFSKPSSYAEFSQKLKNSYSKCFGFFGTLDMDFEASLAKICNKLQPRMELFQDCSENELAAAITCVILPMRDYEFPMFEGEDFPVAMVGMVFNLYSNLGKKSKAAGRKILRISKRIGKLI